VEARGGVGGGGRGRAQGGAGGGGWRGGEGRRRLLWRIAGARDELAGLRAEIVELRELAVKQDDATIERRSGGAPMTEDQYDTRSRRADEILSGPKFATLKDALEYIAFGDNPRPMREPMVPPRPATPATPLPATLFPTGPGGSLEEIDDADETGFAPGSGDPGFAVQIGAYLVPGNADRVADELRAEGYDPAIVPSGRWTFVRIGTYSGLTEAREAARDYRAREGREAIAVKF